MRQGIFLWLQLTQRKSIGQLGCVATFALASCLNIYANQVSLNEDLGGHYSAWAPMILWLVTTALLAWSITSNIESIGMSPRVSAAFRRIGLMTYPLYLLHQISGTALMAILIRLGSSQTLALATAIAFSIGASGYISAVLEPSLQRLTKRWLLSLLARFAIVRRRNAVPDSASVLP